MLGTLGEAGMESQLTLVDTSAYGTPQTVVSFIRDNMKNTKILSADEQPLYVVDTDKQTNARTTIRRADSGDVVAEIKRKDLRADRIRFGTEPSVKLNTWLHGTNRKWSDFPVSFEWQSSKYIWKANSARQIALYEEMDTRTPLAWFQTSRKQTIEGTPTITRALLALQPEAQGILDGIIVSLLVVEHGLRVKEMKFQNADGHGTFKHSI